MDESSAFFLLRHLMYRRNLRDQYLPDMVGLQIKLYQLSRLLRDQLPEVYNHLDAYEVAPTLYAAPWLLTIFASQFPLGFVTRVFDLIFLENTDVIFRVILALLTHHKNGILACDSFEDIMNFLKNKLPQIDKPSLLDAIMKRVYMMDISKQLHVYYVEYNVLQEEMQSIQNQLDTFQRTEVQLKQVHEQNKTLSHQLEMTLSNVQRLEQSRTMQQSAMNRLEANNRSMEVTIMTLGSYLHNLIDSNLSLGVQVPGEVRRILEKIPVEKPKETSKNIFNNLFNKQNSNPNRIMVKSLSTGRITLNDKDRNSDVLRANSLNVNGNRNKASFFSDSHKDILINQQNLHAGSTKDLLTSPDSGVSTPVAHKDIIEESEEDSLNNNNSNENPVEKKGPPLNHCDLNVTVNHRELKKVKSIRDMSRNSSPSPSIVE